LKGNLCSRGVAAPAITVKGLMQPPDIGHRRAALSTLVHKSKIFREI
jgi:hypothetical protein